MHRPPPLKEAATTPAPATAPTPGPTPGPAGADAVAPPSDDGAGGDRLYVNALARGLQVLEAFDDGWQAMGLSDLARVTGLPLATVQRLAHTLAATGYIEKDGDSRRYRLTPRALGLTYRFLRSTPLYDAAIPIVVAFRDEWQETVNVSLLDGAEAVLLIRMPGAARLHPPSVIGRRMPAHATSTGLAQLAFLPEAEAEARLAPPLAALTDRTMTDPAKLRARLTRIRSRGYAVVTEEAATGELALAAPILDQRGRPLAAIGITLATDHWTRDRAEKALGRGLVRAAETIARNLGGWRAW
jgi:DNA-binding IclR family transcriptional regulator